MLIKRNKGSADVCRVGGPYCFRCRAKRGPGSGDWPGPGECQFELNVYLLREIMNSDTLNGRSTMRTPPNQPYMD
jgi:hypothetical protein